MALLFAPSCRNLPRDPERTTERALARGTIRVGVSEADPWIRRSPSGARPDGVDADLIERFARSQGLRVEWHWGSVEGHLRALETFQLDLVAAGQSAKTPWGSHVALTKSYFTERSYVGFPPGIPPKALEGLQVAVPAGSELASLVEKEGAQPVQSRDPFAHRIPVAAPEWQLRARGFTITGEPLIEEKHVLALPPGENGWMSKVERFTAEAKESIPAALVASERQQ